MQVTNNIFIGIDVSKDELVVAYQAQTNWIKCKVLNSRADIEAWLDGLHTVDGHFVLEATGVYSERLIAALSARCLPFSVVNPAQSRAMSNVLRKGNKNDEQDAQTLSILGNKLELMPYHMPTDAQKKRREAFSALSSLQKQAQQLQNQLHAFSYRVNPNPLAVQALQNVLDTTQQAIQTLQQELTPPQEEEEARRTVERISTIKGVGQCTAQAFVTLFGDFTHFESAKAFAKFLGLSPREFTSGTSVRARPCIGRNGNSRARAMLFNCARSAMRYNKNCKELYQRLIKKGKNGKIALTAVMHKLARLIFGVVRSNTPYDPAFANFKTKNC